MEEVLNLLSSLAKTIDKNVQELSKIKDLDQRKKQAEIVKILCESMGVFFDAMNDYEPDLMEDLEDDEDVPF